ncbi:phage tail protein, partial [Aquabacterium sp.]|uniref:phage tail-collar fiber domain-containing protein n=1 Tax=Aquabacterium sp. TaxID=1872578 RepID=UPI0025C6CDD2
GAAVVLTHMAAGDGGGNPIPTDPLPEALVRQVVQKQISSLSVNTIDNTIMMAEMVIPSDEGGYAIREVAIKDATGATFAIGNFPDTYKPLATEGSTREMVIRAAIKVGNAANIQLVIDTSIVLATRAWVESNLTGAYILPGGLTGQVAYKKSNADGDIGWKNITDAINVAVDVLEEVQTTVAGQTVYTMSTLTTDGVAVYIEGVRVFGFTVVNSTTIQLPFTYPTSGHEIAFVQNEPNEPLNLRRTITGRGYFLGQLA